MTSEPERTEDEADLETDTVANDAAVDDGDAAPAADCEIAELQQKVEENWDKYVRAAAELENVRKRAARDVEKAHKFAIERFAADLLAVCDSLEMALAAEGDLTVDSLREGSVATLKLLNSVLGRFNVEALDPHGEPFDPELHEAMTMQPSTEAEPGTVTTVFQKGYALNGRLLRPARVVVAAEPEETN